MSPNPAEEPRVLTIQLSDEEAGHLKSLIQKGIAEANTAHDWGLATQCQILLERLERA